MGDKKENHFAEPVSVDERIVRPSVGEKISFRDLVGLPNDFAGREVATEILV